VLRRLRFEPICMQRGIRLGAEAWDSNRKASDSILEVGIGLLLQNKTLTDYPLALE
jgi:hypothetical protein